MDKDGYETLEEVALPQDDQMSTFPCHDIVLPVPFKDKEKKLNLADFSKKDLLKNKNKLQLELHKLFMSFSLN